MERRQLGPTKHRVPVIGQGTWHMEDDDRAAAITALRAGIDLGMTHIDTAEMYGSGVVETLVGEAIAGRRAEVFLVSKVVPSNASRTGTIAACEASLARLGTEWLDCYLLHWPGGHPLEGTIAAFEQLVREGKILSWGVSNFDVPDLDKVQAITGDGHLACNQVLYHVGERAVEHAVIPWGERRGVATVAYSPLGSGQFPGPRSRGGMVLAQIGAAHGATPHQVALRFLVDRRSVFAIPKSATRKHTAENAAAADLRLSEAELSSIDEAFPRGPRPRHLPML